MNNPNEIKDDNDMFFDNIEFMYKLDVILQSESISYSVANSLSHILNSIMLILKTKPTFKEYAVPNVFLNLQENLIKRTYFCEYCLFYILDNFKSVQEHVNSSQHIQLKQKFPTPEKLYCVTESEKQNYSTYPEIHEGEDTSITSLELISDQVNNSVNTSEQIIDSDNASEKFNNSVIDSEPLNVSNTSNIVYTLEPVKARVNNLISQNSFKKRKVSLREFYTTIIPAEEEEKQNRKLFKKFLDLFMPILREKFPKCFVHFYGSRFYSITQDDSDINMFCDVRNTYYSYYSSYAGIITLENLIEKLQTAMLTIMRNIPQSKVTDILDTNNLIPTIKYQDDEKYKFQITFSNVTAKIYQGKLIKYLFENPLHRKICLGVLNIVKILDLKFTTYQVVLLVLYFYQTKNILPAVYYLQKDIVPFYSGKWQVNFAQNSNNIYCEKYKLNDTYENFESNLMDFCKLYAEFDYKEKIISPYLGTEISTLEFGKTMLTIPSYKKWLIENRTIGDFFINDHTAKIQDPIELNVNVGFEMHFKKFEKFQNFCIKVVQTGFIFLKQFISAC